MKPINRILMTGHNSQQQIERYGLSHSYFRLEVLAYFDPKKYSLKPKVTRFLLFIRDTTMYKMSIFFLCFVNERMNLSKIKENCACCPNCPNVPKLNIPVGNQTEDPSVLFSVGETLCISKVWLPFSFANFSRNVC